MILFKLILKPIDWYREYHDRDDEYTKGIFEITPSYGLRPHCMPYLYATFFENEFLQTIYLRHINSILIKDDNIICSGYMGKKEDLPVEWHLSPYKIMEEINE